MLDRVSSQYNASRTQEALRGSQQRQRETQNRVQTQKRVNKPHEAPVRVSQATQAASTLERLHVYEDNIQTLSEQMRLKSVILQQAMDHLQQIRLDVLQGLNDTYNQEDLLYLAEDVEQQLQAVLALANQQDGRGNYLFAGANYRTEPFITTTQLAPGIAKSLINSVEYTGSFQKYALQISDHVFVDTGDTGGEVFWGVNQILTSEVDVPSLVLADTGEAYINGVPISFFAGDTSLAIADRINAANIAVEARFDEEGRFQLRATVPQPIRLWEPAEGTFWQQLGFLDAQQAFDPSVQVEGFSVFHYVMNLRDALLTEDKEALNTNLRALDQSVDALLFQLTQLGAKGKRLELDLEGVRSNQVLQEDRQNSLIGADLAQELLEYREQELHYQAMLGLATRLYDTNLLEYFR